ncbi:sigma-54-dependent Fis family transcriptional regulator [Alteribacter natronophilus]|uniref:sigma-54-dependent Fis family transcriptional regulator n=1 Tax=Alteribacter natronophilus TaxID=2583810 RepID=UPI00110D5151|nr:sigma-54-dependent Fis family transcriptional regulator [Alteribacter natronophilus]TMW71584.1 CBS domain-containing protein [Alteribacter natronophilus]
MEISRFTTVDFVSLSPDNTVEEVLSTFLEKRVDIACIMNDNQLEGVITKYSLYRLLLRKKTLDQNIKPEIIKDVIKINKDMNLYEARDVMVEGKVSHAVVVDNNEKVFGIMSKSDLIRGIMSEAENIANKMSSLIENLRDAVVSISTKMTITAINKAAEEMFGVSRSTLLHSSLYHHLPEFVPSVYKVLKEETVLESRRIEVAGFTAIVSIIPIKKFGELSGVMIVLRDVTSYESIASELESTKRLKTTLDCALKLTYDGVVITDSDRKITMANDGFLDLFGFHSQEEVIGSTFSKAAPQIPLKTGGQSSAEGEVIQIGQVKCISVQNPIIKDGRNIGYIHKIIYKHLDQWKSLLNHMDNLEHELSYYRGEFLKASNQTSPFSHIVSESSIMNKVKNDAYIAGQSFSTVLINGESGTGKELIAEGIHNVSGRHGAYIKVNCAAIPEELLESEFFGYAEGAFTGAKKGGKPGKFELADRGTLFLDEIGDMPMSLQAKLLRVLQEQEFEKLGAIEPTSVDVRIIAATNKDLINLIKEGRFREDLYYRINVIHLTIPPLRDRTQDIPPLCKHLLNKINAKTQKNVLRLTHEAVNALQQHNWPGNVRQLENVLERAVHFCTGLSIDKHDLPEDIITKAVKNEKDELLTIKNEKDELLTIKNETKKQSMHSFDEAEVEVIINALKKTGGNRTKAAKLLNISRSNLYQKMNRLNIQEHFHYS